MRQPRFRVGDIVKINISKHPHEIKAAAFSRRDDTWIYNAARMDTNGCSGMSGIPEESMSFWKYGPRWDEETI